MRVASADCLVVSVPLAVCDSHQAAPAVRVPDREQDLTVLFITPGCSSPGHARDPTLLPAERRSPLALGAVAEPGCLAAGTRELCWPWFYCSSKSSAA